MASLSLPRVLQLKKNSLDAEREHFEKFQTLAIQKAINSIETPVKEKHVRSTIIGTFQEQSAITYWMVALRLPIQDNRIVAWKFCHVTHKLLREGHPACLDDSQRHINMIENLGKLWVHLREGYGKLVHLYCNLLVCKLKFHARNPRFPGNMQLTADELDAIAENDVNNYFQLCVELFDYMDDILNLQAAVFDSLGNARANSMTASGQCRLAALIPCAQDSSQIYDCNVRLLFRLHASLPPDTLQGHRERFRQQFKKLSSFYKHASSLQYYRNLLSLPVLPSNPPNFLLQSEFGTYVTPVVSIPEPPPDEVDSVGALIDTSDTMSQMSSEHLEDLDVRPTPSPQPDPLLERDRLIEHLQNELKRMRGDVSQMVQERNNMLGSMREHCTRLESQLQAAQTELEEEKQKAEVLAVQTPEIKQKLTETEEKAKVTDEKFQKLKGAYTQLREEHIALIRQKAEVDKLSASLRAAAAQHESAKMQLQQELNDRVKDVELLQQSASSSEEIEAYKSQIANLRTELEQSRQKEVELETLKANLESLQIEHNTAKTENEDKINIITNELKETTETLERIKQEKEDRETELSKVRLELVGLREKSGDEYKKAVEEKDAALKQVAELTQQHQQEKEELTQQMRESIDKMQIELETLQEKMVETENNYRQQCEELNTELRKKHEEFTENLEQKDIEIKEMLTKLQIIETELENAKSNTESTITEKNNKIAIIQAQLDELNEYKTASEVLIAKLTTETDQLKLDLNEATDEKSNLEIELLEKESEITKLENQMQQLLNDKNNEIFELLATVDQNNNEINDLKKMLDEKSEVGDKQSYETVSLKRQVAQLEQEIILKTGKIEESNVKINEITSKLQDLERELELERNNAKHQLEMLQNKLENVTISKDEIINNMKSMVTEKDNQVIALNVEVTKLSEEVSRLTEQLNETQAQLEIGSDELVTLKEEHDNIVQRNEDNLSLKNRELRELHDEINRLKDIKIELEKEKEMLLNNYRMEKQVLEHKIEELTETVLNLTKDHEEYKNNQEDVISKLNNEIENLKTEHKTTITSKDEKIKALQEKIEMTETEAQNEITSKDEIIIALTSRMDTSVSELKTEMEELQKLREKEKGDMENALLEKDKERQTLEARLEHIDSKRLTAECELQDLLQHNSVLEADLVAMKKQLEEAQKRIEEQNTRMVTCAGEAALEVTNQAFNALERSNAQDSNKAAAELAAKALEELAKCADLKGNEVMVAKSAIQVAHNTAQLSAYVTEVSHTATDIELSDKLNNECRSMLIATKECFESLSKGGVSSLSCTEARGRVLCMSQAAVAADTVAVGAKSVDDELADMDNEIEQAANQIEKMLTASRKSDTGVQLEVNEKILDACTTLMAAVKVLVQDSRKLQNELGDVKTRQKMYRKNPQWSEGLISAAKAVVFAAKLLVSAADETVSNSGKAEAVAAAAHEVAGATAQLVAASRARAPPSAPALARLTASSRAVPPAAGAVLAAVRAAAHARNETEALDTSALTLTATRRLEMESKVRSLELETALDAERARLAALRKHHYHLAQLEENGNVTNGKE